MERVQAKTLISERGSLLDAVCYLMANPTVEKELTYQVDVDNVRRRPQDNQVVTLNGFFFRYLAQFDNTLQVRQRLSGACSATDWLCDFHEMVVPILGELHGKHYH